jgi:hypothetical protein
MGRIVSQNGRARRATMSFFRRLCLLLAVSAAATPVFGGPISTVREYRKSIRTYPFSDPNPIAVVGRVYPYFRYDGYTNVAVDKERTVVEIENAYLKVTVLPEIGGKIWSAVEKSTGRSFIYDNHVVKFRDIAMRGPWTGGGIEPNYGMSSGWAATRRATTSRGRRRGSGACRARA